MSAPPIVVAQANPGAGYRALKAEIDAAVARVLDSGWYVLGQEVRSFEAEFATWLGCTAAVGCGNGTDAGAGIARAWRRTRNERCDGFAYGCSNGRCDRDGRRDPGAG